MTVVNPKSISGINSITMASGSDNLLTIHSNNTTERVRVNNSGDVIVGSGVTLSPDGDIFATGVTTSTTFVGALTGNVTGNISGGTVAGSTGTFTGDVDIADKIVHTGDTNTAIRFPSADTVTVEVAGTERLRIDDSDGVIAKHTTAANLRIQNSTAASSQTATLDMAPANGLSGVQLKCTSEEDFSTGANRTAYFTIHNRKDGAFYERLRIDSSGNIGIGGAPSAWTTTTTKALQIGNACLFNFNDTYFHVGQNFYFDGSNYKLINNGYATRLMQNDGEFKFLVSDASGSAGGNINFQQKLRITTGGDIDVEAGDIFFSTAGKGIVLGATSNTDANTLDDYEEGTFTPSFTQGVSGGSYTTQSGHYTKVGRLVMISCRIDGSGLSANNDYLLLGGLPFTTVASGGTAGGLYFAYSDNMYSGSSGTNLALTIIVNNNATVCEFFDGDGTQKVGTDFYDVNRNIHIVGTYHAA